MIEVEISEDRLAVRGHAEAGPHGADPVCAAVTALCWCAAANLQDYEGFEARMEPGDAEIRCPGEAAREVLRFVRNGLEVIEEHYPANVRVEIK